MNSKYILWLNQINMTNQSIVGGKNASLGEMIQNLKSKGINIPNGYVITTRGYHKFLKYNDLSSKINNLLNAIPDDDFVKQRRIGSKIRTLIQNGYLPQELKKQITDTYVQLSNQYTYVDGEMHQFVDVAVRSSSTAEDLPDASFAGQQETYLNIRGNIKLCEAIKNCFASLYTDRAISYRKKIKYEGKVSISVCIQKMVRSDLASSGIAFTVDPDTGFKDVILINGSWGLGELIVGGNVNPDEFLLYKKNLHLDDCGAILDKKMGDKIKKLAYGTAPNKQTRLISVNKNKQNEFCMNDDQIVQLGRWALIIEEHYSQLYGKWYPVDIEWAIDGLDNKLYIVQARPETVQSNKHKTEIVEYHINKTPQDKVLVTGTAVGDSIGIGTVKVLHSLDGRDGSLDGSDFKPGDILVTDMTTPDWEHIMQIAGGIITNRGGRVCHASIIAREFGIPAIVGTTNATQKLTTGQDVSVCCAEGDVGFVYSGKVNYTTTKTPISKLPKVKTDLMLNIVDPHKAFRDAALPHRGVGLLRLEFIINNFIEAHPNALLYHKKIDDPKLSEKIRELIHGYVDEKDYYIKKLSYGIGRVAAAFYPHPVIVRFSDFKSNEYKNLLGGEFFEPDEANPMIGWRGCSRYYSDNFKQAFLLECQAIKQVRETMNLKNVIVMFPFCRTVRECQKVLKVMEEGGLKRGENGLQVYLMCEIPSNVILADQFCKYIDGYSIGTNDLTQLILGLDRDSELVSHLFDERDEAVKEMIRRVIKVSHKHGVKIGICGQASADMPDFAQFLVSEGIDTISITPDSILKTLKAISEVEKKLDIK